MKLFKSIVSLRKPRNVKEVRAQFRGDPRIKGKELTFFSVELNEIDTELDPFTSYQNPSFKHYDLIAVFE